MRTLPDGRFRVEVRGAHQVLCSLAGRLRYRVSVSRGDRVEIEVSRHDVGRGRIVNRLD